MLRSLLAVVFVVFFNACVTVPVQEMSDARQAIQAAQTAGVQEADMQDARSLLEQAQQALELGQYDDARRKAVAAKNNAIAIRESADSGAQ